METITMSYAHILVISLIGGLLVAKAFYLGYLSGKIQSVKNHTSKQSPTKR